MTSADIILIFIGIISLLIGFGQLVVAFLNFLDNKRNSRRKYKGLTCLPTGKAALLRVHETSLGSIHFWDGYVPLKGICYRRCLSLVRI